MWTEPLQKFHACIGKENPGRTSGEGEKKAFGQQLPYESGPFRAKCGPNDDLSLPYRISREKKARDIRACYQQHEPDRRQKHQQGKPDATDENTLKRLQAEAPSGVRNRVFASKTGGDGVQFSLRLGDRNAAPQKAYGAEKMGAAGLHSSILKGSREPKIGSREEGDVIREDCDNRAGLVVERDGFSNNVRIARKPFFPQMTAENYNQRIRRLLI